MLVAHVLATVLVTTRRRSRKASPAQRSRANAISDQRHSYMTQIHLQRIGGLFSHQVGSILHSGGQQDSQADYRVILAFRSDIFSTSTTISDQSPQLTLHA
jgi:hypothetical protein